MGKLQILIETVRLPERVSVKISWEIERMTEHVEHELCSTALGELERDTGRSAPKSLLRPPILNQMSRSGRMDIPVPHLTSVRHNAGSSTPYQAYRKKL